MIKHIVFWTLHEEAGGAGKAENARKMKEALEGLNGRIPGLLHLEVGLDFNGSEAACDVALYSEFDSRRSLDAYQTHPAHLEVVDFIRQVRIDRMVVDYET